MSKYRGPRLRKVRRLGELPALTQKKPKRNTRPGQHGINRRTFTQFAYRLAEKQKLRFHYGVSEKRLIRYVKMARKSKGSTGQILLQQLEMRLDNILYRLGWSITISSSRQLVNHGHVLVDQKQVSIPSFTCHPGQSISVLEERKPRIQEIVKQNRERKYSPSNLSLNSERLIAKVTQVSDRREVPLNLKELLVVEYYSNRL